MELPWQKIKKKKKKQAILYNQINNQCGVATVGMGMGKFTIQVLACYIQNFEPDKWKLHF